MPDVTYEQIAPLVAASDVMPVGVTVRFRCPVSGEEHAAMGPFPAQAPTVKSEVKRSLWRNLYWSLARMIRSLFGYGVGGMVGGALVDTAGAAAEVGMQRPKEAQVHAAIVAAFKTVGAKFAWDAAGQRYVAASVLGAASTGNVQTAR